MPPEQPTDQNPYNFIMNPGTPGKKPVMYSAGGSSMQKRIIFAAIGAVVLVVGFVIFLNVLSSSSKGNFPKVLAVVQDQAELAHITTVTQGQAQAQATKNVAVTVQLTMTSAQSQLTSLLAKSGHKITKAQVIVGESASIDNQLKNATAVSNFDPVFLQVIQDKVTSYQNDIHFALVTPLTKKQYDLLNSELSGAGLLAAQIKSAQAALGA